MKNILAVLVTTFMVNSAMALTAAPLKMILKSQEIGMYVQGFTSDDFKTIELASLKFLTGEEINIGDDAIFGQIKAAFKKDVPDSAEGKELVLKTLFDGGSAESKDPAKVEEALNKYAHLALLYGKNGNISGSCACGATPSGNKTLGYNFTKIESPTIKSAVVRFNQAAGNSVSEMVNSINKSLKAEGYSPLKDSTYDQGELHALGVFFNTKGMGPESKTIVKGKRLIEGTIFDEFRFLVRMISAEGNSSADIFTTKFPRVLSQGVDEFEVVEWNKILLETFLTMKKKKEGAEKSYYLTLRGIASKHKDSDPALYTKLLKTADEMEERVPSCFF